MEKKFTQGEWKTITPTEIAVTGENWACIATVNRLRPQSESPTDRAERAEIFDPHFAEECANAKLIAAAPEMLSALEEALREIEYDHADMLTEKERNHPRGSGWARVYDAAKAAIKKATA